MKLKNVKKYNNKIIQLNLLKIKHCKTGQFYNFKFNSKKIKLNLKKILHIIYRYHIFDKKILFLEFPKSFHHLLKNTQHIFINEHIYYHGFLNNKNINTINCELQAKKTKIPLKMVKTFLKFNEKVDLIVINHSYKNSNSNIIIKESYKSRIPIINNYEKQKNILNVKPTYKMPTNYESLNEKMSNNNLFFTMLKTTLKKAISIFYGPIEDEPVEPLFRQNKIPPYLIIYI